MNWIKGSIRNKLFLISGTGTVLVLGIAFIGLWLSWQSLCGSLGKSGMLNIEIVVLLVGLAVLGAFLVFYWFIQNGIVRPARELAEGLALLAKGDFSTPIRQGTLDELGQVAASAEQLRRDLGGIISEVNRSASDLASSASGLAETARRVNEASERQSEAAAHASSTVDGMASSFSSVAENAEDVHRLAATNLEHTRRGNESLSELVGEMSSVENSVDGIRSAVAEFVSSTGTITSMTQEVKDIAEQTNLLALNAAIEAARAGEQGRGFAVVADEVRKLAEKSAHAASEIDTVTQRLGMQSEGVEESIRKSMESLRLSQDFLEAVALILAEANDSVTHVDLGMDRINQSVREQKAAGEDIAKNVESIARMAEANTASVRQALEESLRLDGMAGHLQDTVKRFRV